MVERIKEVEAKSKAQVDAGRVSDLSLPTKELAAIVKKTGQLYGLTHNYTGYPLVKQARDMIRTGKLGKIRKVVVEYPQGWLATRLEESGQKQASWRTDPKKSGAGGCVGDIGTHAENLAEYITGLKIKELAADLTAFLTPLLQDLLHGAGMAQLLQR